MTCTDLPLLLPLITFNCQNNLPPLTALPHITALEWGAAASTAALGTAPFDVVLAADVLYIRSAFAALLQTLDAVCTADTSVLLFYSKVRHFAPGLE
jgi:predicted nicotinamide N-methyase